MANTNDVVKLAVDVCGDKVQKYSKEQAEEKIRDILIEANNGKSTLSYKDIRDHKCDGLFSLIEEILGNTVIEGLAEDSFFMNLVDFRNVALGDQNLFLVEDNDYFVVAKAAEGTQGVRRQRLNGATEVRIPTELRLVRIYEELNNVLSGRIDFAKMVTKVGESFRQQILNDIYALWSAVTASQMGGATYFPNAGSYDEGTLLDLISHVEAAAGGKQATIIGTKKALRKINDAIAGNETKSDLYNLGYVGKFYGTPVVAASQRHRVGTTQFALDDNVLTIVAGDDKPIKMIYEGDPIMIMGDPLNNADLTQEYLYGERFGMGIAVARNTGIGRYTFSN